MKLKSTAIYLALAIPFISQGVRGVVSKRNPLEYGFSNVFPSYDILEKDGGGVEDDA